MKTTEKCLIRLIDDDARALEGIAFMLACEGYETASYDSGRAFLSNDVPSIPGCVICDIRMPEMSGTEVFETLRARNYPHPFLFMTAFGDIEAAVDALKDGAVDYLVKPVVAEKLFASVIRALRIDRERREGFTGSEFWADRWAQLTDREKEVIRLVGRGYLSRQIAVQLDISQRTVEVHRASGLRKLQLHSPAQVALMLSELGNESETLG